MKKPFTLSIILPVFNEETNIEQTVVDAMDWLRQEAGVEAYEIIAVNDGSTDGTAGILKRLKTAGAHLVIVDYPVNKGYGGALMSGIEIARYDWVLLMDSDGQFKLESLRGMLDFVEEFD
ncbi:MAG: glycosyltransferase family 2 protein, partial [Candidatus Omnitrophica bacterium]|nr:glycosyltransferase family 2 protein [Candidatus Omnitrophota bacterium]